MRFLLLSSLYIVSLAVALRSGVRPTISELDSLSKNGPIQSSQHPSKYQAQYLNVPVDHFHNDSLYEPHTNATFGLRYWFDASHDTGGPVFLLSGGETSGADRLPFLQKGLIAQLAELTGGIAVVLEHRYYGSSIPTDDFSTENLRFLTTSQSMADVNFFAKHVVFKGLEDQNVTASERPYILYGGSYAGAFVAFLRKLYPETFWGAIASSAVTVAIHDYWEYMEPLIEYGESGCISAIQKIVNLIDNILDKSNDVDIDDVKFVDKIKATWQLSGLTHVHDLLNLFTAPLSNWQAKNWDPEVGSSKWDEFCQILTNKSIVYPSTSSVYTDARELIVEGGYAKELNSLTIPLLNHIGYINATYTSKCGDPDECFTSYNTTFYQQNDLAQKWRLWPYQYCTEWGYLVTGSGAPTNHLPIVSRHIDLGFSSIICREAFNITGEPKVDVINQYGGYNFAYDRLAFVDGEQDPWRPATPHAKSAKDRKSTTQQPFLLIDGGVHHWDENGLFDYEQTKTLPPKPVRAAQAAEKEFVMAWFEEWKAARAAERDGMLEL